MIAQGNPPSSTDARPSPTLRAATPADIPGMQRIRLAVRENRLGDPTRVTTADYARYVGDRGASWVAERDGRLAGFGIADRRSQSLWALFVDPACEGLGIGRALLGRLTACLFDSGAGRINLSTEPGTRAERLYLAAGWTRVGTLPNGEAWLVRSRPGTDSQNRG
jgi:GNAT superfamily N-acetyltransferase